MVGSGVWLGTTVGVDEGTSVSVAITSAGAVSGVGFAARGRSHRKCAAYRAEQKQAGQNPRPAVAQARATWRFSHTGDRTLGNELGGSVSD